MKAKLVLTIACIMLVFSMQQANAQQTNYEDIVQLKNGGLYRGVILELVPDEMVKIETRERNIIVVQWAEIAKISREEIAPNLSRKAPKPTGQIRMLEASYHIDGYNIGLAIQSVNAYQFNPYLSLGVGVGLDAFNSYSAMPVFLDSRYYFRNSSFTPFFFVNTGYGIGLNRFSDDAFMFNSGFGLRKLFKSGKGVNCSISYKTYVKEETFVALRIGWIF